MTVIADRYLVDRTTETVRSVFLLFYANNFLWALLSVVECENRVYFYEVVFYGSNFNMFLSDSGTDSALTDDAIENIHVICVNYILATAQE